MPRGLLQSAECVVLDSAGHGPKQEHATHVHRTGHVVERVSALLELGVRQAFETLELRHDLGF